MNVVNIGKAVIRRRADDKYLILRSSKWEERPDRSQKPDLPGGMVESGETIEQGCAREIKEEAGIEISPSELQLVHGQSFISEKDAKSINRLIYFVAIEGEPEVTLSWEHESYQWLTADEVLALRDMRAPYLDIFAYLHKIGVLV